MRRVPLLPVGISNRPLRVQEHRHCRPCLFLHIGGLMVIRWGVFHTKSRTALKTGWLITAGVVALYLGLIHPRDQARGIASEKATGLAAVSGGVGWEPISLWRQTSILPHLRSDAYLQKGIVGGVSIDRAVVAPASLMTFSGGRSSGDESTSEDRRLVRTEALRLIVKTPAETAEKIVQIAQGAGGFLVTSNVNGGADATSALLSIRVPAERFDEFRVQIRKLSLRVESESIDPKTSPNHMSTGKHAGARLALRKNKADPSCGRRDCLFSRLDYPLRLSSGYAWLCPSR